MKELFAAVSLTGILVVIAIQLGVFEEMHQTATKVHNYEYQNYHLVTEVRRLQTLNTTLQADKLKLKSLNEHLQLKLSTLENKNTENSRQIASLSLDGQEDYVQYDIYKWSAEKLLGVAEKELHFKNYEKAAQFYQTLMHHYPENKVITDEVIFQAGIAAYESKNHFDWAAADFSYIIKKYPKSQYFRGAKLWFGLSLHQLGDDKQFIATVEEFRHKYRNTEEWKVLSKYYEDLAYKYKTEKNIKRK